MAPEISPDSIRDAQFRTVIRGVDTNEVSQFLSEVAARIAELEAERDRLSARLGEFADRDLKTEFENVGREVTTVLEAAREAAETMRERATLDAARWRSEAMSDAETERKDARNDAEALRGDAWAAGTELLNQSVAESNRLMKLAERDAITITGEAEREAHRLVSNARRDAEDLVRSATMNAEKLTVDATKAHDEMIEQARRQAEASQERTRALEQRREELMEELDGVRSTLSQLEGTLEAKREDLNLSRTHDTSVRVVPSSSSAAVPIVENPVDWEPGETVRVVRETSDAPIPSSREPDPIEATEERPTRVITDQPVNVPESVTDPEPAVDPVVIDEPIEEEPSAPVAPEPETEPADDEVDALFASLLDPNVRTDPPATRAPTPEPPVPVVKPSEPKASPREELQRSDDLLEARDAMLLPITNRALRGIKKAITEGQNIALDGLRTDADWRPDRTQLAETLRADIITLWSESFSAGHDRAEAMIGSKLKRPATPKSNLADEFGVAIADALESELEASGDGQRERQSAASRVFRAWRTDEAERRVREVALSGFHEGLATSVGDRPLQWVASGTPCSACKDAAQNPSENLPPVHHGCECSVVVAG